MGREQEVLASPSKADITLQLEKPAMNGMADHGHSPQAENQYISAEEVPAGSDSTHKAGALEVPAQEGSAHADAPAAAQNGEPAKKKAPKSPEEEVQVGNKPTQHTGLFLRPALRCMLD